MWLLPSAQAFDQQKARVFIDSLAEHYEVKGYSVAIYQPAFEWAHATGSYGQKALTTEVMLEMGSNTKTFTSACILQLASKGQLALNDAIGQYLDTINYVNPAVTIRQLLNHSSGLYSFTDHPHFFDSLNTKPGKTWDPVETLNQFMQPALFAPGNRAQYCNTGFVLLGLIIEAVTGKAYHEVLRDELIDKQDLEPIYLAPYESFEEERSGTWLVNGEYFDHPFETLTSTAWAAGALLSTPSALAEWGYTLFSGEILNAWTDTMVAKYRINGQPIPYGLGMIHRNFQGKPLFGHSGLTLQSSYMDYDLEGDFAIVAMCNEQNQSANVAQMHNAFLAFAREQIPLSINYLQKALVVYPNPSAGAVNIRLPSSLSQAQLHIANLDGHIVFETPIQQNQTLELQNLPKGVYILRFQTMHGMLQKKLVLP